MHAYESGTATPVDIIDSIVATADEGPTEGIWTFRRDPADLRTEARSLQGAHGPGRRPPLYGVPFAVKDNVDVRGVPTTAGCPAFAYVPGESSPVVDRLRAAGALLIGKTNLDQFATGLVGVRSPYGIPTNPFDARYVTGGSSSGSAAAVARGQVTFAVATDTAGSGRVPAAFNNLVGYKPSLGLVSTRGLVPACRSIDCITVLGLTCGDAKEVATVIAGFDPSDPFSRPQADRFDFRYDGTRYKRRIAVPRSEDLSACDSQAQSLFDRAQRLLKDEKFSLERIDLTPFHEAGHLLYGGPWIAERLSGLDTFVTAHPEAVLSVIRSILDEGRRYRATDAFRAIQRLVELKRAIEPLWNRVDALVVPTAPFHPRIDEVLADPIETNVRLGRYTTFANLLDLAAVAVPCGFRPDGLPVGITLLGPWGSDASLLALSAAFHARVGGPLGATGWPLPQLQRPKPTPASETVLPLAVVGAHLSGEPLNGQLTERGALLIRAARTAPSYRLYALPETTPPRPGLVRVAEGAGSPIALEVWGVPTETVGSFLKGIRPPLTIGTIELEDGALVHGFLCEAHATVGARDVSSFGGWRAYLRAQAG
jgi:allophanate hydrolase